MRFMRIITSTIRLDSRAEMTTVAPTRRMRRVSSSSTRSNLSVSEKSTRARFSRIRGMPMFFSSSMGCAPIRGRRTAWSEPDWLFMMEAAVSSSVSRMSASASGWPQEGGGEQSISTSASESTGSS